MEIIATTDNTIREKYNIRYHPDTMPLICFATVNFYNEINQPQNKGMFQFFDRAFIGKSVLDKDFIVPLSYLVDYVNERL